MNLKRTFHRFAQGVAGGVMMLLMMAAAQAAQAAEAPALDANYPGGNIAVVKAEGDTLFLKPDLRDTQKGAWWFYWNFRVRGAAGRTLHFRFVTVKSPIGVRGPALSLDGGLNWTWMGETSFKKLENNQGWEFSYAFAPAAGEVRFACVIPYLQSNLDRFLARYRGNPHLNIGELCKSRRGRSVERLHMGKLDSEPKVRVLLTARHHACESMANYEQEGIMESILADTPEGRVWREKIEVMIVPFMDKDGVEAGDQGKNRAPHDHNRDYGIKSIYPEVRALTAQVPGWLGGKPVFAMDMHCPYLYGDEHLCAHFVGGPNQAMWQKVMAFGKILQAAPTGPNPYHVEDNLPFGKSWNTAANITPEKSRSVARPSGPSGVWSGGACYCWMETLPGAVFASSQEFPYASARGTEVNAESAREFGRGLARAMLKYLKAEL